LSTVVNNVGSSRRRIIGALAGLAIGAAGVLVPGAIAQASPSGVPTVSGSAKADGAKVTHNKIPAGARRVTGSKPTPGAHGPAFQQSTLADVSPYVVGGQLADPRNYPGVVGIQTYFWSPDETGTWVYWVATCTGSVISPTKVLTAAHCTVAYPFATTYVIAGRQNLDVADPNVNNGGFVARVGATWTNQGYNYADPNAVAPVDDVSVLTLKDALPSTYTPVTLTAQGNQSPYAADTQAKIAGYGVTSNDPNAYAGVLYEATVPMQSDSTCASTFGSAYDQNRMICAGTSGVDSCHGDSGGPIFVNGAQAGIVDWGPNDCASSYGVYERLSYYHDQVTQDLTRPDVVNLDWSGDGHSDLMARNGAGDLVEVDGSGLGTDGYGGIMSWDTIGTGWQIYNKLFRVTNWSGDGNPAIMGRDSSGRLFQYKGNGADGFNGGRIQVGSSWNGYTDIMVTNNWTGNGLPNLMGRTSTGDLFLYTSDGHGGWLNNGIGIKIGTGWNGFNTVLTPGTWAGDGHQALIGRTAAGDLMLYKSDGHGGWMNNGSGVKIGSSWGGFKIFMSPGDWNGDRQVDLLGITPGGVMSLYKTDGYGNWLDGGRGQQIDTGWDAFNAVF
jgi:V8-like Glu-specific endopeptidase